MAKKNIKKMIPYMNKIFPLLIIVSTLFMGIGYASVNSVILNIEGKAEGLTQEGVYIEEAYYDSNINANESLSKIYNCFGTNMSSYISLKNESTSEITYKLIVYNSTNDSYYFDKVLYLETEDDSTYSNDNITYKLTNLKKDDIVAGKGRIEFYITFYYLDTTAIEKTDLKSLINFKFIPLKDKIVVNLNSNGGAISETIYETSVGSKYSDLPLPTYTYYSFEGWYDSLSGGTKYNEEKIASAEDNGITLYARWKANPIAINNIPTILMSQSVAKKYYGQIVNNVNGESFNPNSSDQRTWRVFYIDTDNKYGDGKGTIYLKADEVSSKTTRFSTSYDATNNSGFSSVFNILSETRYYKVSGSNIVDSSGNIINTHLLKLNPTYAAGRINHSSYNLFEAEKAAAYLSDYTQFTSYTDSRTNYAIGSPTVEMWIDSWNAVYGSEHPIAYQYNVNVDGTTGVQKPPGYQLKYGSEDWDQAAGADTADLNSIDTTSMYKTSYGMWYASPAIVYGGGSLIRLSSAGFIGNATINMSYGYSPVVSLNSQSMVYTNSYTG